MKLPIYSWKNTLRSLGLRAVRTKQPSRRKKQKSVSLGYDPLEPRQLLAAAPELALIDNQFVDEGQTLTISASYTDADAGNSHSATIDWGDGTVQSLNASSGSINASHVYADNGNFQPVLTLTAL